LKEQAKKLEDSKKELDGKLNDANALVSSTKNKLSSSMKHAEKYEDYSKKELEEKNVNFLRRWNRQRN
jgi:hypothetical protein